MHSRLAGYPFHGGQSAGAGPFCNRMASCAAHPRVRSRSVPEITHRSIGTNMFKHRHIDTLPLVILLGFCIPLTGHDLFAQSATPDSPSPRPAAVKRLVTQGLANTIMDNLFSCAADIHSFRKSPVGEITADDGAVLTVPANTAYASGRKLADLYNDCGRTTPQKFSDVQPDKVPIVEIDPDGEVITGFIVADNYFELYVNGTLVGVDPVPYTPFNSVIVRFRAKRPISYALKLVAWEERL